MKMYSTICHVFIAAILVLAAGAASAQDNPTYAQFNDRFRVYLGGFWPEVDSKIGINGDFLPPGPPVDVEDTLGVVEAFFEFVDHFIGVVIGHVVVLNQNQSLRGLDHGLVRYLARCTTFAVFQQHLSLKM